MAKKQNNIPVSMDDDLLGLIDALANEAGETRSAVMRAAIREGLAKIEHGGSGDAVFLDRDLSAEVDQVERATGYSRTKVLLEAVRAGLPFVQGIGPKDHFAEENKTALIGNVFTHPGTFEHTAKLQFKELGAHIAAQGVRLQEVEREIARLKSRTAASITLEGLTGLPPIEPTAAPSSPEPPKPLPPPATGDAPPKAKVLTMRELKGHKATKKKKPTK